MIPVTIHASREAQRVRVSISGLGNGDGRNYVLEETCKIARGMLADRAAKRRFKLPLETYFEESPDCTEHFITGDLIACDSRGRRASVRLEIAK